MNRILAILLTSIVSITCIAWTMNRARWKPRKVEVKGTILITHDYCGGARPGEDQLHPKPYPVNGTVMYIRKANSNDGSRIIDSAVTDKDGKFTVKLAPGTYCFVEKWKKDKYVAPQNTQFATWDTACYRKRYNVCDYTFQVKGDTAQPRITLRKHCPWTTPCSHYNGPFPPSAPPVNRSGNQPGHQE